MDLPPSAPFPFRVRRYRVGFFVSAHSRLDNPMSFEHLGRCVHCGSRPQSSRASRGKTRALLVSRPASAPFGSGKSDIGARSLTPARPPPGTHLAGSLFATYTSSASCFLQAAITGRALALLALPSVRSRWLAYLLSARVPCPAHVNTPPPEGRGLRVTTGSGSISAEAD